LEEKENNNGELTMNNNDIPQEIVVHQNEEKSVSSTQSTISSLSSDTDVVSALLNLKEGMSGSVLSDLLQHAQRCKHVKKNLQERYDQGKSLRRELEDAKGKITAGTLFKCGKVVLDDELLILQEEKEEAAQRSREEIREKQVREYESRQKSALSVLQSTKTKEQLTSAELKAVVLWKKRKGDKALPTTKALLLEQFDETIDRPDLTVAEFLAK